MRETQTDELTALETAYAENPDGRVFAQLAEAYRKAGDLERAYEVLRDGVERHPEYPSAQIALANLMVDMGDADAADRAWRAVLALDPENVLALRGRGDLARAAGRRNEALNFYQQLAALGEDDDALQQRIAELQAPDEPAPAGRGKKRSGKSTAEPVAERAPRRVEPEPEPAAAPRAPVAEAAGTDAVALTELLVRLLEHESQTFQAESSLTRILATAVGRELELDDAQLAALGLAALLSNVGAAFADEPATTGQNGDDPRRGREQRRVSLTLQLLQEVALPAGVHDAVRHQHERWDGTGYPAGMQADEIPFGARIVAAARAVAARLVHAPGHTPQSVATVLAEVQRGAGVQFDPVVVSVMRRVFAGREMHRLGYGLGGRVLVVHPEELRAMSLAGKLNGQGYTTEMLDDVSALRERLRRGAPQAIVVAADLPDGDVARLVRELRGNPQLALVPIVVLDANSSELRVALLAAGADVSFARDVSFAEMRATLDALLRRAEIAASPNDALALANDAA